MSELVGELLEELLTEPPTHVPRPALVVVLLREATDVPPGSEAESKALTLEMLERSVVQLLVDRAARLIDSIQPLKGLGEL